jgi:hypothetical protein
VSPPVVRHAIDVAATPEACWKVLADLGTWPRWFPRLKYASVLGGDNDPWRVGGRFEIVFDFGLSVSVRPVVEEIEKARRVRWVGKGMGIQGNHSYTFETKSPGLTRVTSHEEFSGLGARLMTRRVVGLLDTEVHRSMERFKALVENRA